MSLRLERHDDRSGRTSEWSSVVNGAWVAEDLKPQGKEYNRRTTCSEPKPRANQGRPIMPAATSEGLPRRISFEQKAKCDCAYVHCMGRLPEHPGGQNSLIERAPEKALGWVGTMQVSGGVDGYASTRDYESEVAKRGRAHSPM